MLNKINTLQLKREKLYSLLKKREKYIKMKNLYSFAEFLCIPPSVLLTLYTIKCIILLMELGDNDFLEIITFYFSFFAIALSLYTFLESMYKNTISVIEEIEKEMYQICEWLVYKNQLDTKENVILNELLLKENKKEHKLFNFKKKRFF